MNAIPSKMKMDIVIGTSNIPIAKKILNSVIEKAKNKYSDGKHLKYKAEINPAFASKMLSISDSIKALTLIKKIPNGVHKIDKNGNPITSSNIGVVTVMDGECELKMLFRSVHKEDLEKANIELKKLADEYKIDYVTEGVFPAWPKIEQNPLDNLFLDAYKQACGFEGLSVDIHSGLECGYLANKYPNLIMASVGCDVINEHTRKETLFTKSIPANTAAILYVLEHMYKLK